MREHYSKLTYSARQYYEIKLLVVVRTHRVTLKVVSVLYRLCSTILLERWICNFVTVERDVVISRHVTVYRCIATKCWTVVICCKLIMRKLDFMI